MRQPVVIAMVVVVVLGVGGVWLLLSGFDTGPDVVAAPRPERAVVEAPAPPVPFSKPTNPPPRRPPMPNRPATPSPDAGLAAEVDILMRAPRGDPNRPMHERRPSDPQDMYGVDQERLREVVTANATRRIGLYEQMFDGALAYVGEGPEREKIRQAFDDALTRMQGVRDDVAGGLQFREGVSRMVEIRAEAGAVVDATLPPDQAAEVKRRMGMVPLPSGEAQEWSGEPFGD